MSKINIESEKALLVGIRRLNQSHVDYDESLIELGQLALTAGVHVVASACQQIKKIDPATYVGRGKVEEIASLVAEHQIEIVIFDDDLSPRQNRNLEKDIKCKVLDRTGLILNIFALHASSKEGKLQVELAQTMYLMPRLVGRWEHFGRLAGGGVGTRGPGETQLEVDRRRARERISSIKKKIKSVEKSRDLHSHKREGVPISTVAMVGYTNAGKSTLFNRLTSADVFVEDQLFATLDPTVRKLFLPSGAYVLLSDTVGFIRNLPHQLIEAFKATFKEVARADLLLHVIDRSRPVWQQHKAVVESVLSELSLEDKPRLDIYNKLDLLGPSIANGDDGIYISAREGKGIDELCVQIERKLRADFKVLKLKIPYGDSSKLEWLYNVGEVRCRKDEEDGVYMEVCLGPADVGRLAKAKNIQIL